jgi:hypothetical protein
MNDWEHYWGVHVPPRDTWFIGLWYYSRAQRVVKRHHAGTVIDRDGVVWNKPVMWKAIEQDAPTATEDSIRCR